MIPVLLSDFGFDVNITPSLSENYRGYRRGKQLLMREVQKMEIKTKKGNAPDYNVAVPSEGENEKIFWHNIGSAWVSDKGISVVLKAHPIGNKFMLFKNESKN